MAKPGGIEVSSQLIFHITYLLKKSQFSFSVQLLLLFVRCGPSTNMTQMQTCRHTIKNTNNVNSFFSFFVPDSKLGPIAFSVNTFSTVYKGLIESAHRFFFFRSFINLFLVLIVVCLLRSSLLVLSFPPAHVWQVDRSIWDSGERCVQYCVKSNRSRNCIDSRLHRRRYCHQAKG